MLNNHPQPQITENDIARTMALVHIVKARAKVTGLLLTRGDYTLAQLELTDVQDIAHKAEQELKKIGKIIGQQTNASQFQERENDS